MSPKWFASKKIVVMGLGLHGGGRAIAEWLYRQGSHVIVTDTKSEQDLLSSLQKMAESCASYRNSHLGETFIPVAYHLGGHLDEDFRTADLIIQNPGVPRDSRFLAIAREQGIPVQNEATLFFALTAKTPKIAITGTRGKSTTTSLAAYMLRNWNEYALDAGVATHDGVRALFDIIDTVLEHEEQGIIAPVVVELSSWQLELFEDTGLRPAIAVVTNILRDHLNHYRDRDDYARAKRLITAYQGQHDALILNYDNSTTVQWGLQETIPTRYWFTRERGAIDRGTFIESRDGEKIIRYKDGKGPCETIMPLSEVALAGDHNCENILAAVTVAKVWGVPNDIICEALQSFRGVPDRLEMVSRKGGREWVNDTTATTPDAVIAALKTVAGDGTRRIVLIAGGADKQLEYTSLAPVIKEKVSALILFSGTATPLLVAALKESGCTGSMTMANSMRQAVEYAWSASGNGDMILLSPGAASFGMFINEFDRGRQFVEAIENINESASHVA